MARGYSEWQLCNVDVDYIVNLVKKKKKVLEINTIKNTRHLTSRAPEQMFCLLAGT